MIISDKTSNLIRGVLFLKGVLAGVSLDDCASSVAACASDIYVTNGVRVGVAALYIKNPFGGCLLKPHSAEEMANETDQATLSDMEADNADAYRLMSEDAHARSIARDILATGGIKREYQTQEEADALFRQLTHELLARSSAYDGDGLQLFDWVLAAIALLEDERFLERVNLAMAKSEAHAKTIAVRWLASAYGSRGGACANAA